MIQFGGGDPNSPFISKIRGDACRESQSLAAATRTVLMNSYPRGRSRRGISPRCRRYVSPRGDIRSHPFHLPPWAEGDDYRRADPSTAEGTVDRHPSGVCLKAQASTAHVNAAGSTIVEFHLAAGATIAGRVTHATTGPLIDPMDLDCSAGDPSYPSSANAKSAANGTFRVGAKPEGINSLRSAGDPLQGLAFEYYGRASRRPLAAPIQATAGYYHPGGTWHSTSVGGSRATRAPRIPGFPSPRSSWTCSCPTWNGEAGNPRREDRHKRHVHDRTDPAWELGHRGRSMHAVPQHGAIRRSRAEVNGRIAHIRAGGWSRGNTGSFADDRPRKNLAIEASVPSGSTPPPFQPGGIR